MFGGSGLGARPPDGSQRGSFPGALSQSVVSKAAELEGEVKQQGASLEEALCNIRAIDARLPSIERTLDDYRRAVERRFVDAPSLVNPIEEDASQVRDAFAQFSQQTQGKIESLRGRLAETSSTVASLASRCERLNETTQAAMGAMDVDLARVKENLKATAQKLVDIEAGLVGADPILRDLLQEIEKLTRSFRDRVAQFQSETAASFNTSVAQLEDEMKTERKMRVDTVRQIDDQLQEIQQSTSENVKKMSMFLTSSMTQYQQALADLRKKAKEGADECASSAVTGFRQVGEQIEQFVQDSGAQFQALEGDMMSTIEALELHIAAARNSLQATIASVSTARVQAETETVANYDQLKLNVTQLLQQQVEHIESSSEKAIHTVTDHCSKIIVEIREELGQITEQSRRIARLENKIAHLGAAADQTRSNLIEQIHSLGHMYMELQTEISNIEQDFERRQAAIESRIAALENPDNHKHLVTRSEVGEIVQRARAILDGRLQGIEEQLGLLLQNVATLTLNSGRASQKSGQSGSEMLSELVAQT